MRYTEFNLTEDELFELNMSPGNLKKMAGDIDARAGMEFELIVPGVESGDEDEYDSEPDYDADERFPTGPGWTRDIISFFRGGDMGNSTSTIQRAIDSLNEDFYAWVDADQEAFVNSVEGQDRVTEIAGDNVDRSDYDTEEEYIAALQNYIDENEGDIRDQLVDEYNEDLDSKFEEWLDGQDIRSMSEFANEYNLDWPYWTEPESYGRGGADIDTVADDFSQAIGRPVNAASSYHGGRREAGHYVVEPDGSLQGDDGETGLEFVSPVLTIPEMLEDIDKVAKWAGRAGAYTNESTGLHINVSVPDQQNLDYVKLAMFLGDDYILEQFGRAGNSYAKSALKKIKATAASNPDRVAEMMRQFQGGLNQLASKMIHTGSTEKFTSINNRDGWIEFRGPGGDWLGEYATGENKVTNTLLRAVVALDVATKPEAFKQEYYKKLYKTLNPKGDDDTIQYFARYAAGELPQSALKAFVRNIQAKRQMDKVPKDVPQSQTPMAIYQIVNNDSGEVLSPGVERTWDQAVGYANNMIQAYQIPREDIRIIDLGNNESFYITGHPASGPRATASHPEGRGRPHDPNGRYAIVSREDPAAYQTGRGTEPEYLFRFNMAEPAEQHNGRYILAAWAARNGVDPANYMVVDAERWNTPAGVPGSTNDMSRQRLAAQMPALDIQNGNWEVYSIASNNSVYRFAADTEEQAVRAFNIWQDAIRNPVIPRATFNLRTAEPGQPTQTSYNPQQPLARGSESLPPGNQRWLVLDRDDNEVYSFVNTTAQSDANQYARDWMINRAPREVRDNGPFTIVPAR
jgi:hypothetical protein